MEAVIPPTRNRRNLLVERTGFFGKTDVTSCIIKGYTIRVLLQHLVQQSGKAENLAWPRAVETVGIAASTKAETLWDELSWSVRIFKQKVTLVVRDGVMVYPAFVSANSVAIRFSAVASSRVTSSGSARRTEIRPSRLSRSLVTRRRAVTPLLPPALAGARSDARGSCSKSSTISK